VTAAADWDCEAYGPGGRELGAVCFIAPAGQRTCPDPFVCALVMGMERERVHERIRAGAAAGDETSIYLLQEFPTPSRLLNGGGGS
jgi:hypothetical protein